jgi:hypothetical protein
MNTKNAASEIEPASVFLTLAENPTATSQIEGHKGKKSLRLLAGILMGVVFIGAVGYFGIALKRHAASRTQELQRRRALSELQAYLHGILTVAADNANTTPEMRADYLASRAKVDALFAVDARCGTHETSIFIQQDIERRERLTRALGTSHRQDPQRLLDLYKEQEYADSGFDKMVDDPRNTPEMRADELAARAKVDALFALDAHLGTSEEGIFLQQEIDHSQRVLDAMKAANAAAR